MNTDIQPEITTKAKFWGKVTMGDLVAGALIAIYSVKYADLVYTPLKIPAILFFLGMGLYWLLPHPTNKKMRNYQHLITLLMRNRRTLHAIDFQCFDDIS